MKIVLFILSLLAILQGSGTGIMKNQIWNELTQEEKNVIEHKGTERPFSGKYYKTNEEGVYLCKRCNAPLYKSDAKFDSGCGWPSFDDEIAGAVKRVPDADGRRVEIICANCEAHLGHVFEGEGLTDKNVRHCVNSLSIDFKHQDLKPLMLSKNKKAYFAGGCFWGVEYYFEDVDGVISADSGYMGGALKNPTYKDVSRGDSGHLEVVEVTYDPTKVDYETLARLFFEIHDPTQKNGQGPDIGEQYLSAVFVSDESERKIIEKLTNLLESKGLDVATKIVQSSEFYKAEEYHQDYYKHKNAKPYCHIYIKRF
ncbi:MAG: bifunctional methionine sulfoxide reductase B/A protein [Epsilonproteobacteria bacterium]|nr:bifunctional methionine sulfoxide reductase B/A protein [Campylobacterota bacterium]OIO17539.1 MAG: methionine sulfoxide reductase [Helicobacteraceae bacterium CG1_02_36_14]PIP10660.1 MAG: methionine sulfoxide reductase [Sulfurimonas sp. CG23_combo_of_CG06-09_8_20_14_all_36_33]PIS25633.1 MAG: methionine sulfoxide reductase [Sulfurimonas sp. CG08_land_8_20_14_0_20_36_33]PIU34940.1 MAG: methionine sulfoxide reductase [Sulfurimonas sp. CG07_land_8_20_14_0_80_36_56]PIV04653.1 MAG: methionine su